ncbi:MAG: CtsR family transcriptional regulator [Tissierellia bacterium]|nr:CtsR family transcriptional regulator [Tissierellia bacterium]
MARLSNIIEQYINSLLEEQGGTVIIQRNVLAEHFSCAPSQINYVLTTRFTPYKGYFVESRRGGGGYIRILQVEVGEAEELLPMLLEEVGDSITSHKARDIIISLLDLEKISSREAEIITLACSDRSLSNEGSEKNVLRANILKNILLFILQ